MLQGALLNPHSSSSSWPMHPDPISMIDSRLAAPDLLSHTYSPEKPARTPGQAKTGELYEEEGRNYRELIPDPQLEVVKVRAAVNFSFKPNVLPDKLWNSPRVGSASGGEWCKLNSDRSTTTEALATNSIC